MGCRHVLKDAGSHALSFQPNIRGAHRGALPEHTVVSRIGGAETHSSNAECGLSLQNLIP